jgi:hypothetical protein
MSQTVLIKERVEVIGEVAFERSSPEMDSFSNSSDSPQFEQ